MLDAASNRYKITIQVANRAKRRRYEDIDILIIDDLIATGGTGGHVFPAYSLANYLTKNNYNVKLTIDDRGLKYLKYYKNLNLHLYM